MNQRLSMLSLFKQNEQNKQYPKWLSTETQLDLFSETNKLINPENKNQKNRSS